MKFKKCITAAFALFLTISQTFSLPVHAEETYQIEAPHMYAHAYAVMDANYI